MFPLLQTYKEVILELYFASIESGSFTSLDGVQTEIEIEFGKNIIKADIRQK